ncbi:MAG: hypothetical protein L3K19_02445 [Thermoplasmata archaeon]|nr:hypothetical protein [Thermoplasmata archaeon]
MNTASPPPIRGGGHRVEMLLNGGEAVLKTGPVTRVNPQGNRDGVLTVTNQRVVFEARVPEGPQGQPIVRTTIDAPLHRLKNALTIKPTLGRARLELELPQQRALFETPEAEVWLGVITQARAAAPPPPAGAGGGPGRAGGGGGGAPAVMLRCRYCGTLNPPTVTKCSSCGAAI